MSTGSPDELLARLALHYKLATPDQIRAAQARQAASGQALGPTLVELGVLEPKRLEQLEVARAEVLRRQASSTPAAAPPATAATARSAASVAPSQPAAAAPAAARAVAPTTMGASAAIPDVAPAPLPALEAPAPTLSWTPPGGMPLPPQTDSAPAAPSTPSPSSISSPTASPASVPTSSPSPIPTPTPAPAPRPDAAGGQAGAKPAAARLDRLLEYATRHGASDVHLHSGAPIRYRRHGRLIETEGQPLEPALAERAIREILPAELQEILDRTGQVDLAYEAPGLGRFRVNAYRQARGLDAVFRSIPQSPPSLEDLGLPASLAKLADYHQGLVLVTGPAGCGKSATLAALLHLINGSRRDHIISIEDPIEILHPSLSCVVNQRQVGRHTESFARALRAALREDPDVIAIGELRDLETISLAITAAETGHLVLATLHTSSAIRTVNRILGVFPPNQQEQIRTMLSESLRAVVSQRLIPRADGNGRAPALEVLIATKAVGNLIRENKTFQLKSVLQTGVNLGMCLLDLSLAELVKSGAITREEALRHAEDPAKFAPPSAAVPSAPVPGAA